MSETAKAYRFGEAPKRIELRGDKTTATESAQHIITFPGGAIELARVGDDEYWVHVTVNRREQTARRANALPLCLGTTKTGAPRHPLYVSYETALKPWQPGWR